MCSRQPLPLVKSCDCAKTLLEKAFVGLGWCLLLCTTIVVIVVVEVNLILEMFNIVVADDAVSIESN